MATREQIQELADRLISTLSMGIPSEQADAIVADVATSLYRDVLGVHGGLVLKPGGIVCGNFGAVALGEFEFKEKKQ